jgi:hypothetical protein
LHSNSRENGDARRTGPSHRHRSASIDRRTTHQIRPEVNPVLLVKSAKFVKDQVIEGRRESFTFQCANEAERDHWVSVLRSKIQTVPLATTPMINPPMPINSTPYPSDRQIQ